MIFNYIQLGDTMFSMNITYIFSIFALSEWLRCRSVAAWQLVLHWNHWQCLFGATKQKGKCRTTFVDLPGPAAITGQPSRESAVWNSLVASTQIYIYDLINEKKKSLYFFSFPISNSLRSNRVPCSWISILDQCRPGFLSTSTRCCCW